MKVNDNENNIDEKQHQYLNRNDIPKNGNWS